MIEEKPFTLNELILDLGPEHNGNKVIRFKCNCGCGYIGEYEGASITDTEILVDVGKVK